MPPAHRTRLTTPARTPPGARRTDGTRLAILGVRAASGRVCHGGPVNAQRELMDMIASRPDDKVEPLPQVGMHYYFY